MTISSFNLADLNGSNGFVINDSFAGEDLGTFVSGLGDINGDGFDDIIIGACKLGGYYDSPNPGRSYVVFGDPTVGSNGSVDLSTLDGSNGFVMNDPETSGLGACVSGLGDINGDGFDDLIIGAPYASNNGNFYGASYVVFGGTNVGSNGSIDLDTLDGSNGFVINGLVRGDYLGTSVSGLGDINGDGFDDMIIGAPEASNNDPWSGASYVVFGGTNVGSTGSIDLDTLDGSNGFVINGLAIHSFLGTSVSSLGDINGDGIEDLIIGAYASGSNFSGASYVVFGSSNVGSTGSIDLDTLDGSNGFVINGLVSHDSKGISVSNLGDINGDGFDDLIIGAPYADSNGLNSGASYVVFGGTTVGSTGSIDVSTLDGSNGFVINGLAAWNRLASSVSSAGDVNSDGIDDLIIGVSYYNTSYVVFGGSTVGSNGSVDLSTFDGSNGLVIDGVYFDRAGTSVSSAGDIDGDGIDDLIIGAPHARPNGASYVVFGNATLPFTPSAVNDIAGTTSNTPVTINVLANDSDPNANILQIDAFSASSTQGSSITLNDNGTPADFSDDQLVYTPVAGFSGLDSFSYTINNSNGGTDTTTVTVAVFTQIGNPDNDTLVGASTGEKIWGQAGNDLLTGGEASDWLRGGRGDDVLTGGDGIDVLSGGFGNDVLTGGGGSDRFVLKADQGTDAIADFEHGIDRIILTNTLTFGQLDITQSNSDTLISLVRTGEVLATLTGVSANLITYADFYTSY
jgi:hypothetical protein